MMAENEPLHPAVNPDLYVNLDEQREGYAPIESRGWDVLTQNLSGKGELTPAKHLTRIRNNARAAPLVSVVGFVTWLI
jgi:hypothetical protein